MQELSVRLAYGSGAGWYDGTRRCPLDPLTERGVLRIVLSFQANRGWRIGVDPTSFERSVGFVEWLSVQVYATILRSRSELGSHRAAAETDACKMCASAGGVVIATSEVARVGTLEAAATEAATG